MRKITLSNNKKKPKSPQLNPDPSQEPDAQQLNIEQPQNPDPYSDISQDPDFKLMLAESQQGHWKECKQLITILDEKYPGNSKIAEFKKDFELQVTIINDIKSSAKEDKKNTLIHNLKILGIIAGSVIAAFLIVFFVSKKIGTINQEKQLQSNAYQINILSGQAESLLNSGQPEKVEELIQRMKAIDPTSPKIIELSQKMDEILRINTLYLDAIDKLNNGLNSDALSTLMKIESEYPGYKDVSRLIENTNSKINLSQALSAGTEAFNAGNWQETIGNFEQVLTLDPANSDSNLKGMLVNSYLHRIIQLLEDNNTTFSEINQAELYFSRAIIMIPQIKDSSSEQENLKQTAGNLLELKYTQAAEQLVKDPAQTLDSVNLAFNYLNKALSLDPQNSSLQAEVYQLNLYNTGFHYYIDMNWPSAIQQLTALTAIDESYPNGFARQLLYEAHTSQGDQNYSVGSYLDARKDYEIAETLTSGKDNLLSYYLAEINLGRTLGKLNQYKDANSYFNNAIQSINYEKRGSASPTMISDLHKAVSLNKDGQYENSYNLFVETLVGNDTFYEMKKINAFQGNCLALIAAQSQSSVQAILEQNNLPQQTIVPSDQIIIIPSIP
jgi:tetratricopeptide (TPR) repeat protein